MMSEMMSAVMAPARDMGDSDSDNDRAVTVTTTTTPLMMATTTTAIATMATMAVPMSEQAGSANSKRLRVGEMRVLATNRVTWAVDPG